MKMVWQQAIPKQIHGHAGARAVDGFDECVVVAGFVKHRIAAIAPIEDVIPHSTQ
jgi:hypothetical protein